VAYPAYYGCCGAVVAAAPAAAPAPAATKPSTESAPPKMEKLPQPEGDAARRRAPATVIVKAPADVVITVNGQLTTRRSPEEAFLTPDLNPGRSYAYEFTAELTRGGEKVIRTRRITVRAGGRARVDFSAIAAEESRDTARVTVVLPPNSRLLVDGVVYAANVTHRTFETPKLKPGKKYHYTLQAEVERGGRKTLESRRVQVQAGRDVLVNFTQRDVAKKD
jgi:uncharacterized protein (TIGR03000 family)